MWWRRQNLEALAQRQRVPFQAYGMPAAPSPAKVS
jgi:hypothetical protein